MSLEEMEKKKVVDFIKGFLIMYCSFGILNFSVLLINAFGIWAYICGLIIIGILFSVIFKRNRNENPNIPMGMITAIFGLAFLYIKGNGEPLVDPYTENPKKRKTHFYFGILLSICLVILHIPSLYLGYLFSTAFGLLAVVIMSIILLNIFVGVLMFFYKENLQQISKGFIFSIPLILFLISLVFILSITGNLFLF